MALGRKQSSNLSWVGLGEGGTVRRSVCESHPRPRWRTLCFGRAHSILRECCAKRLAAGGEELGSTVARARQLEAHRTGVAAAAQASQDRGEVDVPLARRQVFVDSGAHVLEVHLGALPRPGPAEVRWRFPLGHVEMPDVERKGRSRRAARVEQQRGELSALFAGLKPSVSVLLVSKRSSTWSPTAR